MTYTLYQELSALIDFQLHDEPDMSKYINLNLFLFGESCVSPIRFV